MVYVDKDIALLYGILLGDGCLSLVKSKHKFISITGCSFDDIPFYEMVISPILRTLRGKETKIKFRKGCNAIDFNFTDIKLFDLIHSLGFPVGKKGPDVIIPDIFYKNLLVDRVVQGFFATDGSLVLTKNPNRLYPRIEAHAIHKYLLLQIHSYLISRGMNGHFYQCKRVKEDLRWNSQKKYKIQFNGRENLIIFDREIGFVNPKHKDRFRNFFDIQDDAGESRTPDLRLMRAAL